LDIDSVKAYDLPDRVRMYDSDMDIMHPLRWKMIEIALEIIPFHQTQSLMALDLGIGTGIFSKQFLEKYQNSKIVAIDGAASMLENAKSRLGRLSHRVEWILSEFQTIPNTVTRPEMFDVVISSYALHHLNAQEKLSVLKSVVQAIKPAGWFLNADIVVADVPDVEQRIQEIRVNSVTERAPLKDKRFRNNVKTGQFLNDLEANEPDKPLTLNKDIQIIREAGITNAEVFWKEYREVVIGGFRTIIS